MDNDLIQFLLPIALQAIQYFEGPLKKAGLEAAKAGSGELGKLFAKSFTEKTSAFLGKLFLKRPLVEAIKEIEQKKPDEEDKKNIVKNALNSTMRFDIEISIEAKDLFELTSKKGDLITITISSQNSPLKLNQSQSTLEYIEDLNARVSQIRFPGIPEFPSGIEPTLNDIYVDQKFRDLRSDQLIASHYYELSKNSIWLKDTAGTGKSTFIRHITSLICKNYLDGDRNTRKTPIRLHAGEIVLSKENFTTSVLNQTKETYNLSDNVLQNLLSEIMSGNTVLLIDAIDEIPYDAQKHLMEKLSTSDFFVKSNQIILTSRPLNYLALNISSGQIQRFKVNDAYKLISNWQNILGNQNLLTSKADELLEKFKNEHIGKIYKAGGVRSDIVETPLFLTFLIFYLISPRTIENPEPFSILTSKTRLLSQIIEYVIPYWESQKFGAQDLITPVRNAEALQVLYFIGYFAKSSPNLSTNDLLWGLSLNEKTILMDSERAKEYMSLWSRANVIKFDGSRVLFWHEELKDYCAAKYLFYLYKNKFIDDLDIQNKFKLQLWKTTGNYFNNILRQGG